MAQGDGHFKPCPQFLTGKPLGPRFAAMDGVCRSDSVDAFLGLGSAPRTMDPTNLVASDCRVLALLLGVLCTGSAAHSSVAERQNCWDWILDFGFHKRPFFRGLIGLSCAIPQVSGWSWQGDLRHFQQSNVCALYPPHPLAKLAQLAHRLASCSIYAPSSVVGAVGTVGADNPANSLPSLVRVHRWCGLRSGVR